MARPMRVTDVVGCRILKQTDGGLFYCETALFLNPARHPAGS